MLSIYNSCDHVLAQKQLMRTLQNLKQQAQNQQRVFKGQEIKFNIADAKFDKHNKHLIREMQMLVNAYDEGSLKFTNQKLLDLKPKSITRDYVQRSNTQSSRIIDRRTNFEDNSFSLLGSIVPLNEHQKREKPKTSHTYDNELQMKSSPHQYANLELVQQYSKQRSKRFNLKRDSSQVSNLSSHEPVSTKYGEHSYGKLEQKKDTVDTDFYHMLRLQSKRKEVSYTNPNEVNSSFGGKLKKKEEETKNVIHKSMTQNENNGFKTIRAQSKNAQKVIQIFSQHSQKSLESLSQTNPQYLQTMNLTLEDKQADLNLMCSKTIAEKESEAATLVLKDIKKNSSLHYTQFNLTPEIELRDQAQDQRQLTTINDEGTFQSHQQLSLIKSSYDQKVQPQSQQCIRNIRDSKRFYLNQILKHEFGCNDTSVSTIMNNLCNKSPYNQQMQMENQETIIHSKSFDDNSQARIQRNTSLPQNMHTLIKPPPRDLLEQTFVELKNWLNMKEFTKFTKQKKFLDFKKVAQQKNFQTQIKGLNLGFNYFKKVQNQKSKNLSKQYDSSVQHQYTQQGVLYHQNLAGKSAQVIMQNKMIYESPIMFQSLLQNQKALVPVLEQEPIITNQPKRLTKRTNNTRAHSKNTDSVFLIPVDKTSADVINVNYKTVYGPFKKPLIIQRNATSLKGLQVEEAYQINKDINNMSMEQIRQFMQRQRIQSQQNNHRLFDTYGLPLKRANEITKESDASLKFSNFKSSFLFTGQQNTTTRSEERNNNPSLHKSPQQRKVVASNIPTRLETKSHASQTFKIKNLDMQIRENNLSNNNFLYKGYLNKMINNNRTQNNSTKIILSTRGQAHNMTHMHNPTLSFPYTLSMPNNSQTIITDGDSTVSPIMMKGQFDQLNQSKSKKTKSKIQSHTLLPQQKNIIVESTVTKTFSREQESNKQSGYIINSLDQVGTTNRIDENN